MAGLAEFIDKSLLDKIFNPVPRPGGQVSCRFLNGYPVLQPHNQMRYVRREPVRPVIAQNLVVVAILERNRRFVGENRPCRGRKRREGFPV